MGKRLVRKKKILMLMTMSVFLLLFGVKAKAETDKKEPLFTITNSLPRAGEAAIDEKIQKALEDTEPDVDSSKAEELTRETLPPLKGSLRIAVVGEPNTEILEAAAVQMRQEGYVLEIISCEDYESPNTLLLEGKVEGNLFQHSAYLELYNRHKEVQLVSLGAVYYEPLGIYPGKCKTLEQVSKGAKIGVPEDPTGYAKALLLLQQEGLLTLMEDTDLTAIWEDVIENPLELKLIPLKEEELVTSRQELDLALFHGSYALGQQLSPHEALATEKANSLAAKRLSRILVTRGGDEEPEEKEEGLAVLMKVLQSEEMQEYIEREYRGSMMVLEQT